MSVRTCGMCARAACAYACIECGSICLALVLSRAGYSSTAHAYVRTCTHVQNLMLIVDSSIGDPSGLDATPTLMSAEIMTSEIVTSARVRSSGLMVDDLGGAGYDDAESAWVHDDMILIT